MAYAPGYNIEKLMLREITLVGGTFADLDTITPADDPEDPDFWTPSFDFGYIRMGTIVIGIKDSFVKFLAKTPHQVEREDLLQRDVNWMFTANQFDASNFQKLYNLYTQQGLFNQFWIGSDTPTRPRFGVIGSGTTVDNESIKFAIFNGSIMTEDISLKMSGTDYVDEPALIQAFPHPDFLTDPTDYSLDQKCYGMIWTPGTSS